jgi:hypothetical protein
MFFFLSNKGLLGATSDLVIREKKVKTLINETGKLMLHAMELKTNVY